MRIANKTHYYHTFTREFNEIPDTNSFSYQSSKRLGFLQRLYYEYQYVNSLGGIAFFYTLTYNDKSLPMFVDRPCFCKHDIRLVTNGLISKVLKRKYNCLLRYFCACETGEGKGVRGIGNNPHYHIIFFVIPIDKTSTIITPADFRALVRKVWHGTDEAIDYKDCKFGIAREGDNLGVITNIAALRYVSKYVVKDEYEKSLETYAVDYYRTKIDSLQPSLSHILYYYRYNTVLGDGITLHHLFYSLGLDRYNKWRKNPTVLPHLRTNLWYFYNKYATLSQRVEFVQFYQWFKNYYKPMYLKQLINNFRCNSSGKVRCSKSLGIYGLNFIQNVDSDPTFKIPINDKYEYSKPCLYYYRHLYYSKSICKTTGNVLYRLNARGINLKLNHLEISSDYIINRIRESMNIIAFNPMYVIDNDSYNRLQNLLHREDIDSILYRYSIYKIVYRHRYYEKDDFIALDTSCNLGNVLADYRNFLYDDAYNINEDYNIVTRHKSKRGNSSSFDFHPAFYPYLNYFKMLDYLLDVVDGFRSDCAKARFTYNNDIRYRHSVINVECELIKS